mgnify:CR=1 FL=1
MTQEFHLSVTPLGNDEYLVRTEEVAQGVPLAEEQVSWAVDEWLTQARQLMGDPLLNLLQTGMNATPAMEVTAGLSALGQQLYEALFQGTLRDSWISAQSIAQHRQDALRLRLGLKGSRLIRLPWEVMQGWNSLDAEKAALQNGSHRPLATGTDVVFSRYYTSLGMARMSLPPALEPGKPLRILMAIAAPDDRAHLNLHREVTQLQQELLTTSGATQNGSKALTEVQLKVLDQPSRERLTSELEQGQYHIFHFAGHSEASRNGGQIYLVNERTGLTEVLSGDDLAGLLVNNHIRMAVLNSCRGAYTATDAAEGDRSLAEALVSRGIPAVLAMADNIPDEVALHLSRLFYRNLKQGYPIDLSLSRARQGLISSYSSQQFYWALPVLYLHQAFDGYLMESDRPMVAPVDRRLHSLPAFRSPSDWITDSTALPRNGKGDRDAELIAQAVMGRDDLEDLGNLGDLGDLEELLATPRYDLEGSLEDDLTDDPEANAVARLISQLSATTPDLEEPLTAAEDESLLPEESPSIAELYDDLPEYPGDRPASSQPQALPLALTTYASAELAADEPRQSPTTPNPAIAPRHPSWLRLGLVAAGVVLALGVAWAGQNALTTLAERPTAEPTAANPDADLEGATTATGELAQVAIAEFGQGNLDVASEAVAELLNRGALQEAKAALDAVPNEHIDAATVSFLRGRLAWEFTKRDNTDYSPDDALRFWSSASAAANANPEYLNALGFAYYSDDRPLEAIETWCRSLTISQGGTAEPLPGAAATGIDCPLVQAAPDNPVVLDAYAGIAIASSQLAIESTGDRQLEFLELAQEIHQIVLSSDPVHFQTQALSKDWLWSEEAIQEWQTLVEL